MKLFHYTLGIKLESIFEMGLLRTSPIKPQYPEKPICWLSSNPNFEMSALKLGMDMSGQSSLMTLEQMSKFGDGLYRFVFESEQMQVDIYPWAILKPRSKAKPKITKRLIERAKLANANPNEWFGTLDQPISIANAVLEVGEIKHNGEIEWSAAHNPIVRDHNVLQMTLTDLKRAGVDVECNNQTWAIGQ
ncbi:hypothetical protein NMR92_001342 [Vibrio cholerae]|uniref:Uncharacterized protein n=3 Tax=Vibrio TaxID=662 RepID=A0A1B1LRG3_VIBPH|nr:MULTISPECIES: hypothetical protein [Vibrio]ANS55641.1 hypothetical protein [Vibrio parahaemolyticus]EJL6490442.1 hypothetical protein [Vibrio cholerae]EJL6642133.1 hypothetical protein [Vibrio cholerae]MBL4244926.1 hypothetical protein [Vibrio fluvialis]MBL4253828.1 hypothetical protein [Vibrio fluvialis]